MADVNVFDYVTDRLDILRGDIGTLVQSHHDLRVEVAGIQTQVRILYSALGALGTGAITGFFYLVQQLARLSGKA